MTKRLPFREQKDRWCKYHQCRWEIVRRTPEYKNDFQELSKQYDPNSVEYDPKKTENLKKMFDKWGFGANPESKSPGLVNDKGIIDYNAMIYDYSIGDNKIEIIPTTDVSNPKLLLLINLNAPLWFILSRIEDLIWGFLGPPIKKRPRFNIDEIKRNVKMYDMNKEGKSNSELAKLFFPSEDIENGKTKIKQAVKKIEALIKKKGYF